jgi:dTMP kinase
VGRTRISARVPDHFEREQRPFFERVRAAYLALAERHPQRIKVVDATKPLDRVQQHIGSEVRSLIERFRRESK